MLETPLQRTKNVTIARLLLDAGATDDASRSDDNGTTALTRACESGGLPLVQLLIERKADINARNGSPLVAAADREDLGVLGALLASGTRVDRHGHRAVSRAAARGRPLAVQMLVSAGASPLPALMGACDHAHVRMLVEAAPEVVNMVDEHGNTAVLLWIRKWQARSVVLIQQLFSSSQRCGAVVNVNKRNAEGHSALDEALCKRYLEVVERLMMHGALICDSTVMKPFECIMHGASIVDDDQGLSACLRTIFEHALATGCFVQPTPPAVRMAACGDTDEEEPAVKRRRLG
jgi:ankyrin repeat protein